MYIRYDVEGFEAVAELEQGTTGLLSLDTMQVPCLETIS